MKSMRLMGVATTVCVAIVVSLQDSANAADKKKKPEPQIVKKILKVEYSIEKILPPNLVVTATGQVPSSGYKDAILVRVRYTTPPADGIQDYILFVVPPTKDLLRNNFCNLICLLE